VAKAIGARVLGNDQVEISRVASIASARTGDLVFVEDKKHLESALESLASAVICGSREETVQSAKSILICKNPRLAFAHAAKLLPAERAQEPGIHPSAVVDASADLGEGVGIDARVVVDEDVSVGERTRIGAGCVLGATVTIGEDCKIHPNVTIYPGTRIGARVIIHAGAVLGSDGFGYVRDPHTGRHQKFPQVGTLEIEDDVEIGANTTIDRGALDVTRIARGAKIDNLVHIGHNCLIGENVIIAAQAGFSGSITVENNAVIGGQVGVGEKAKNMP